MTTRAERKQLRRERAAWLRTHGLAAAGEVWRLASGEGVQDLSTLVRAAAREGGLLARRADGARMPASLRDGRRLPTGARVIGSPVIDPDTASVWVCVREPDGTTRDVELAPLVPIGDQTSALHPPAPVTPKRTAPAWVQTAAAEYRDARDAWLALRESCQPLASVSAVAGAAGSAVSPAQLSDADFAAVYPRPQYRDYLREHAARQRQEGAA